MTNTSPQDSAGVDMDRSFRIPHQYGDNKIVLMVRDPWTIYSYWETSKDVEGRTKEEIQRRGLEAEKSILRVYEIIPGGRQKITFDFDLRGWANSWYVHTGSSGKEWVAEVGIICKNGEFFSIARSNSVRTPTCAMSNISDEEWMCSEELYYKMFEASGGYASGGSSLQMRESISQHLIKWLSSGGITSGFFGRSSFMKDKD